MSDAAEQPAGGPSSKIDVKLQGKSVVRIYMLDNSTKTLLAERSTTAGVRAASGPARGGRPGPLGPHATRGLSSDPVTGRGPARAFRSFARPWPRRSACVTQPTPPPTSPSTSPRTALPVRLLPLAHWCPASGPLRPSDRTWGQREQGCSGTISWSGASHAPPASAAVDRPLADNEEVLAVTSSCVARRRLLPSARAAVQQLRPRSPIPSPSCARSWEEGANSLLVFQVKLFMESAINSTDPKMVHLLHAQAVHHVITGIYPVEEQMAVKLAALQVQARFGDHDPATYAPSTNLLGSLRRVPTSPLRPQPQDRLPHPAAA